MPAEQPVRLHIAALSSQHETFWVTEDRFRSACDRHPEQARCLRADWSWDLDRFEAGIAEAEILIGWRFETADLRTRAPRLKWIQLTGAGSDHLQPFDWLPRGLALTNNSGAHGPKAAEFAATALLMLNHGLPHFATAQRARRWDKRFTTCIEGKTVLLLGLGAIGAAVARWLNRRLGLRVIALRRSGSPQRGVAQVIGEDALDRVLPEADFVVVTLPLTPDTENLLDCRRIGLMKPGAGLVNLGRARVVDYQALAEALEAGRLSGAVLDVFDPEPLPRSSPLWTTRNLMLVPHCSSDDAEAYIARTLDLFFENLARYRAGRPLKNRISRSKAY